MTEDREITEKKLIEGKVLGRHIIADFIKCSEDLSNEDFIREALLKAVDQIGGRVYGEYFRKFSPYGISGFIVIAESHISIHTWPEDSFAAVDIFTCGSKMDPWKGILSLIQAFKPSRINVQEIKRGTRVGEEFRQYVVDYLSAHTLFLSAVKSVIYSGRTKYQAIDYLDTHDFGKTLILDNRTQSSTKDEYIYHESLVHPAMITHPNPKDVLIIGGGEGATAREVLKHKSVSKVTMVEIDNEVIEVVKKYAPEFHQGSFFDKRLNLIISEGRCFLEKDTECYDVIIVDATDPVKGGLSCTLYTKEFYEVVFKRLKEDGIMVTQATSPYFTRDCFSIIYRTIASVFPIVRAYQAYIPSYGGMWGFVIGSKKYDPTKLSEDEISRIMEERGLKNLKFYGREYHKALFLIPKEIVKVLSEEKRIATDSNPLPVEYV